MSVKIRSVIAGSPADKKRIKSGDELISINGNTIDDVLDYQFYVSEPKLKLEYIRDGKYRRTVVRKSDIDDLGLEFDTYLMDKQRHCRNKCVFCFIDQLPKGLRDTLYFKDDDSRMSFLFGNYITLTNLTEHEVDRIIKMHISPINISVHTTNPELRVRMMNNPHAGESLNMMYRLANAGTKLNCQLVICPEYNDGDELVRSIRDLAELYPAVQSIACVPVGVTKFRDGLAKITPFNPTTAAETLDIIEREGERIKSKIGERLVYASDEFYIMSGRELPCGEYYGDYDQLDNGVGICTLLREEFVAAMDDFDSDDIERNFTIATGAAVAPILREMVDIACKKWHNLHCNVVPIINHFFGEDINVTGLITGTDLISQLERKSLGDRLLLSVSMFRNEGDIMLDDTSVADIESALGVTVQQVQNDGYSLLCAMLDL